MLKKGLFTAAFFLLIAGLSTCPAQDASSQIGADTLGVGDRFHFTLLLRDWDDYDEVIYPDSAQFGADFEILDRMVEDDGMIKSVVYELQYFGAGNTYVPDTEIGLRSGSDTTYIAAPGRSFTFDGLVAEEDEEFRPFKSLFEFTAFALWMWVLIAGLFALGALFAYLYLRERNRAESNDDSAIEAEDHWESPLDRLKVHLWRIQEEYQPYTRHYEQISKELSIAFRTYLQEVHQIPALESTYSEIARDIDYRMMPGDMQQALNSVLQLCDRIKFGGKQPDHNEIDQLLNEAVQITNLASTYDRGLNHLIRIEEELHQNATQSHPVNGVQKETVKA